MRIRYLSRTHIYSQSTISPLVSHCARLCSVYVVPGCCWWGLFVNQLSAACSDWCGLDTLQPSSRSSSHQQGLLTAPSPLPCCASRPGSRIYLYFQLYSRGSLSNGNPHAFGLTRKSLAENKTNPGQMRICADTLCVTCLAIFAEGLRCIMRTCSQWE